MSLKTKLILASCGPLLILLVVGLISIRTITQSSKALERIFRENYDSVTAGLAMKQAIQEIERGVEPLVSGKSVDKTVLDSAVSRFSQSLKFQQGNVTLPGERNSRTDWRSRGKFTGANWKLFCNCGKPTPRAWNFTGPDCCRTQTRFSMPHST